LPVVVSRHLAHLEVVIYNESGEVVRNLYASTADSVTLTSGVDIQPGLIAPSYQGGTGTTATITLTNGLVLSWDGKNNQGSIVANGQYFVEVKNNDGQGASAIVTKEITVVAKDVAVSTGKVLVYPNPAPSGTGVIHFQANPAPPVTLTVSLYSLAGELVQKIQGGSGSSKVDWDYASKGVATGVYVAVIEIKDANGGMERRTQKVAVIR